MSGPLRSFPGQSLNCGGDRASLRVCLYWLDIGTPKLRAGRQKYFKNWMHVISEPDAVLTTWRNSALCPHCPRCFVLPCGFAKSHFPVLALQQRCRVGQLQAERGPRVPDGWGLAMNSKTFYFQFLFCQFCALLGKDSVVWFQDYRLLSVDYLSRNMVFCSVVRISLWEYKISCVCCRKVSLPLCMERGSLLHQGSSNKWQHCKVWRSRVPPS